MLVNLKNFVEQHYRGGIMAKDVVREAVTNAIQAGATVIKVNLDYGTPQEKLFGSQGREYLNAISISDNGEGFTDENLQSFYEVCTEHRKQIGGKGVGRLSYLKYGKDVVVTSQTNDKKVQFNYNFDFELDKVESQFIIGALQTQVRIGSIFKPVDTQVKNLVETTCDALRLLVFLEHQKGKNIEIVFTHNSEQQFDKSYSYSFSEQEYKVKYEFELCGENFTCHLFKDEGKRGIYAMLCADNLCVETIDVSKRFDVARFSVFITSDFFNKRANIERQHLVIDNEELDDELLGKQGSLIQNITREMLFAKIHEECLGLVNNYAEAEIESFKANNLIKLKTFYPFIERNAIAADAALLDADEIIRQYRKKRSKQEDALVAKIEAKKKVTLAEISPIARDDLARYIVHRSLVIDSLNNMPIEEKEIEIHNAFLPKKANQPNLYENNLWLLDDKFLSYSNVFSDQAISKIVTEVSAENKSIYARQPDVAIFFSKDDAYLPNKLVIIEFKKLGADIYDSQKAITQCRMYAMELAKRIDSICEVFAFAIAPISDEFYDLLLSDDYKSIFSIDSKIVYRETKSQVRGGIPVHQYVMPLSAVLVDAKARNKVFEDILRLK